MLTRSLLRSRPNQPLRASYLVASEVRAHGRSQRASGVKTRQALLRLRGFGAGEFDFSTNNFECTTTLKFLTLLSDIRQASPQTIEDTINTKTVLTTHSTRSRRPRERFGRLLHPMSRSLTTDGTMPKGVAIVKRPQHTFSIAGHMLALHRLFWDTGLLSKYLVLVHCTARQKRLLQYSLQQTAVQ